MGSAYTNNFRLCLPQKKRWRLAVRDSGRFMSCKAGKGSYDVEL